MYLYDPTSIVLGQGQPKSRYLKHLGLLMGSIGQSPTLSTPHIYQINLYPNYPPLYNYHLLPRSAATTEKKP